MSDYNIDRIVKTYNKVSIWIISGLAIMALLVMQLSGLALLVPVLVSVVYSFIVSFIYSAAWKRIASVSPEILVKFYLAGSTLRIIAGLCVVLAYCFINRSSSLAIICFMAVFMTFYIVMLVFDSLYFAKIERTKNIAK